MAEKEEKTVICLHSEPVNNHGRGECRICHQVRQYNLEFPTRPPVIVKRGRINGVLTVPFPKISAKPKAVASGMFNIEEAAKIRQAGKIHRREGKNN